MTDLRKNSTNRSGSGSIVAAILGLFLAFATGCQATRGRDPAIELSSTPPDSAIRSSLSIPALTAQARHHSSNRDAGQSVAVTAISQSQLKNPNVPSFTGGISNPGGVSNLLGKGDNRRVALLQEGNDQTAPSAENMPSAENVLEKNLPTAISLKSESSRPDTGSPRMISAEGKLSLEKVFESVESCLPQIEMAMQQIEAADGNLMASMGKFDTVLSGHSLAQPLGFYETYRNQLGINQPLWGGGEVYGTYRLGDGNFEPWYGERETNEGGELKAGFSIPLLKNSDIDERRANVLCAAAVRTQNQAGLGIEVLNAQRMAAAAYWNWVAAGQALTFRQQILTLAEQRVAKIELRVEKGDLAKLVRLDNQRFIAKRTSDVIKARRKLQQSAIKLSIYYRDSNCQPVIVDESQLPQSLPVLTELSNDVVNEGIAVGTTNRPEVRELDAIRQQYEIKLRYAENLLLPKLDLKGFAGQDLGGLTSKKGDKQPLEIQAGVIAELPWQRREGLGKSKAAQAKLAQLNAKLQLTTDKIRAEITDAASAINNAAKRYRQAAENLKLTADALGLGKIAFEGGEIDLIQLNIYETSVASAKFDVLDAELEYSIFQIVYKTATSSGGF